MWDIWDLFNSIPSVVLWKPLEPTSRQVLTVAMPEAELHLFPCWSSLEIGMDMIPPESLYIR